MKAYFASIVASLLLVSLSIAQPTVTRDWIGKLGDEVVVTFSTEVPDPGPSGAAQTWDFSGIEGDTIALGFAFIDPIGTPYFADFPNSNISLSQSKIGIYGYLEISDDRWEDWGSAFTTTSTVYDDPQTEMVFPFDYQDSFTDDYSYITDLFGVNQYGSGSVRVEYDGYGTLILPNGTFDDCVRIKVTDSGVDSTDLGLGIKEKIVFESTTYFWYSRAHPGPLCQRDYSESTQIAIVDALPNDTMALDPDSTFSFDPSATSSGLTYFKADAFELSMSPNPFTESINLAFTAEESGMLEVELKTINGQLVYSQRISAAPGANNITVNPPDLPSGNYLLILRDNNQGAIRKAVKID